jgi:hypothetical protein
VKRWAFNLAAAVSLLVCAAVVVLWVRSCREAERWEVAYGRERPLPPSMRSSIPLIVIDEVEVLHYQGQWLVQSTSNSVRRPSQPRVRREVLPETPSAIAGGIATGVWGRGHLHDFGRVRFVADPSGIWDLGVHDWVPLSLTSLLPILWVWRLRRNRPADGFCPKCGYDLRATTDRCPECGTVPAKVNA